MKLGTIRCMHLLSMHLLFRVNGTPGLCVTLFYTCQLYIDHAYRESCIAVDQEIRASSITMHKATAL